MTDLDDLDSLASLADRVRRRAYQAVAEAPTPVGRDEVAEALGVGRTLAAFHLDKLVAAGLLETSFARRTGKTGPGAGRPAKLYQVAAAEHAVSVPPRAYDLAAEVLAEAVERAGVENVLNEVAQQRGREAAEPADVIELLSGHSYAPVAVGEDRIELRNCPFHRLAEQFPPVLCGMNLALVGGLLTGQEWTARMEAAPGRCCVVLSKE